MSKLIEWLIRNASMGNNSAIATEIRTHVESEALHIYNTAAEQMRSQRQGLTQDYQTTVQRIQWEMATILTQELTQINLLNPRQYSMIKKAIESWHPAASDENGRKLQAVRQNCLLLLPEIRKIQALEKACITYKNYLKSEIESELASEHPAAYQRYCSTRVVTSTATATTPTGHSQQQRPIQEHVSEDKDWNHFLANESKQLPIDQDGPLKKAIQKYEAMNTLQNTLYSKKPAPAQIQNFSAVFRQTKPIIEQSRDSMGDIFLKAVATICSCGLAAVLGIWNVKGEKIAQKMASVLEATPIPSNHLTTSR